MELSVVGANLWPPRAEVKISPPSYLCELGQVPDFCISSFVNGVMLVPTYLDTEKTKQSEVYRVLLAILGI